MLRGGNTTYVQIFILFEKSTSLKGKKKNYVQKFKHFTAHAKKM